MNNITVASIVTVFVSFVYIAPVESAVSAFSRANCYVPIAEIGWESLTWGWPASMRATSSWHKRIGENNNSAHNIHDNFNKTWRSFAGDSHGPWELEGKYEVRGKHWWSQHEPFIGIYNYKNSYANDCNLAQW